MGKKIKADDFVHLHVHSEYSLLDGMCRIETGGLVSDQDYVYKGADTLTNKTIRNGQKACAITDHGTIGGYYKYYNNCRKYGLNPIIGCEFYMVNDATVKDKTKGRGGLNHITVIAKNLNGLGNLFAINQKAWSDGFYYKARTDLETIYEHREDLIVMSACTSGPICERIIHGKKAEARNLCARMHDMFGEDFYLEIMPHEYDEQVTANKGIIKLSKDMGIPLVATNDVHYLEEEDWQTHEVYLCIQTKGYMNNPNRFRFSTNGFFMRTRKQMLQTFKRNHPYIGGKLLKKAHDITLEIADKVDIRLPEKEKHLPVPKIPSRYSNSSEYLVNLVKKNWKKRKIEQTNVQRVAKKWGRPINEIKQIYVDRINRELEMMLQLGFQDYFIIVYRLCNWVKKNNILKGVGRGSVGGSLVCHVLGIISIDPVEWDLMFERFMSQHRISEPDIDLDFEDTRRNEVRDYLFSTYGLDYSAAIGTWGLLKGKQAIRDISRAFNVPLADVNSVTSHIIQRSGGDERKSMTIMDSFEEFENCKEFNRKYPYVLKHAAKIEGLIRQGGVHACGVVVSNKYLSRYVPIEYRGSSGKDKVKVAAMTAKEVEKNGLLKIDVLSLRTLSIMNGALELIKERTGKKIDISTLSYDDPAIIQEFTDCNFVGIFQYDSVGMTKTCADFTFRNFDDVGAMNALYRPGAMRSGFAKQFIDRARGKEKVPKVHPIYDEVCGPTYGIILYQEQVSGLFHRMAGLPLDDADHVRAIISKSQGADVMEQYRSGFVNGCAKNGLSEKKAKEIFDKITFFASYSFNKSHSYQYGAIAYQCMWLKHYYPKEYMASLIRREKDDDKIVDFIKECKRLNIKVEMPNVNVSKADTYLAGDDIVYGLEDIKKVGVKAAISIQCKQPFTGMYDFLDRVNRRIVHKGVMKSLATAGALRDFCSNRRYLCDNIESIVDAKSAGERKKWEKRMENSHKKQHWTEEEQLMIEKTVISVPGDKHLISFFFDKLKEIQDTGLNFDDVGNVDWDDKKSCYFAGVAFEVKYNQIGDFDIVKPDEHSIKKSELEDRPYGSRYCTINLENQNGFSRMSIQPKVYSLYRKDLEKIAGKPVIVRALKYKKTQNFFASDVFNLYLVRDGYNKGFYKIVNGNWHENNRGGVPIIEAESSKRDRLVPIQCTIMMVKKLFTKKGELMAFIDVEDISGRADIIVFPKEYKKFKKYLKKGNLIKAIVSIETKKSAKGDKNERSIFLDSKKGCKVKVIKNIMDDLKK